MTFHPQIDGETEVVNKMIAHIQCMYNFENPCTWDENLPYVQYSYNSYLHNSTDHSPFQLGLGFYPLCPIDVVIPFVAIQLHLAHVQAKFDRDNNFIECI